ncbi:MAG: adenosylcobinamide amidohydrolase [Caldisphaeraceae archaeon]|nr:adenosylcobinamide amidohydrolase [Caldisphaeraceae archaeon]
MKGLTRVELIGNNLIIKFEKEMTILSTAHVDGIAKSDKVIISRVVDDKEIKNVESFKEKVLKGLGYTNNVPVMITSVNLSNYKLSENSYGGVLVTAGFSVPNCIYQEELYEAELYEAERKSNTINIISWINEPLTMSGLLDLFRVVSETKCLFCSDILLRCKSRSPGTSSDGITVAANVSKTGYMWSGLATLHGNSISRLIYETLKSLMDDESKAIWLKRMLGMDTKEIINEALKFYEQASVPHLSKKKVRRLLMKEIDKVLSDPNVWSFIIAARELDIRGQSGTFPLLKREEFDLDTKRIIADELLASALSLYISGFKGLTATYWVDSTKEKISTSISKLPMFEDDIISALIGSSLSRVYDKLLSDKDVNKG